MYQKIVIATLALMLCISQAEAKTEQPTVFMLDKGINTTSLIIHFNSQGLSVGPTRLNETQGEFRTILTPHTGVPGQAEFIFASREIVGQCKFISEFKSDALSVQVSVQSRGEAYCWITKPAPTVYVLHAIFDNTKH